MMKKIANVIVAVALVGLLSQSAIAAPVRVPDAGTTSLLFAVAIGGLAAIKRFLR